MQQLGFQNNFTKTKDTIIENTWDEKTYILHIIVMLVLFLGRREEEKKRKDMGKVGPLPKLGEKQMKELSSLTGPLRKKKKESLREL